MNAPVDLTNCDREPIHIPGAIQDHGALIACDATATRLTRYSGNAGEVLGFPSDRVLIGAELAELFGWEAAHAFRNLLGTASLSRRPALMFGLEIAGRCFDVSVHRSGPEVVIEFERCGPTRTEPLNIVRTLVGRAMRSTTLAELTADAAKVIRAVARYDRVMVYRFEADGSGQVINEAKNPQLESFLGQYFPASDIPQQARALYLRNTIRIIKDSSGTRVPIHPEEDDNGNALDLSDAHLRSVSPIHCEYLRNMGVAASMSISLVVGGSLWGMIACHHYSPKHLDMAERAAMEMLGEFLSSQFDLMRQKQRLATVSNAHKALDMFLRASSLQDNVYDLLSSSLPEFVSMIESDGVGLWIDGRWAATGSVPPQAAIPDLLAYLDGRWTGRIWASRELSADHPPSIDYCAEASGLLAIPLSQRPRDYLIFFRKEFEHTLNWAGNPEKTYDTGPLGDRLTPRKSFAIWKETVKRQSRPWDDGDRETAEAVRSALVEIVLRHNEIVADERGRADLRQRMLNEELNHRVKNILAVIKSLVGQSEPEGRTLEEYRAVLRGRVDALAVAHDQVARGGGGGSLTELLRAELRPYEGHTGTISLKGPAVWVDKAAFSVLALVFHELATNAAKYGALSRSEGGLFIDWSIDRNGDCNLVWLERGGPAVLPPTRRGFGSTLVGRSVPHELGGSSHIEFEPEGLRASFSLPGRHLARVDETVPVTTVANASMGPVPVSGRRLEELSVLLVEDQMLIAMDVEMMLAEVGVGNVTTVASTVEGLRRLQTFRPDAAILDVNLGIDTSIPVAEQLFRLGVPFIFATGYGDTSIIPAELSAIRVIRKPYSSKELVAALRDLVSGPHS